MTRRNPLRIMLLRTLLAGLAGLAVLAAVVAARAADIRTMTSPSGIGFWIVEDYTVPIVTLSFEFDGGANQDPAGKAGLSAVLAAMMDEGADGMSTAELKAELEPPDMV